MKKKFLVVLFIFLFFCSRETQASEEFETDYEVRYQALAEGKMRVHQKIRLTNKLARIHATKYSLTLQGLVLQNLSAWDQEGALATEIKKVGETTIVNLTFNQVVVGAGKTLEFELVYETTDLVKHQGQVWEINIPRLTDAQKINHYELTLAVPIDFGPLAYITPQPLSQFTQPGLNLYVFSREQITSSGVKASFGRLQIFDFLLIYHLENPRPAFVETQIALPPDTVFQQVAFENIKPAPNQVSVDPDGNWLATYRLSPKENKKIVAAGKAKIFAEPRFQFPEQFLQNPAIYLQADDYWPVDSPVIKNQAARLKTPRAIYNYVVGTLDYDYERVKTETLRLGALAALENPKNALCMEFTDLFVTLTRAAGIPARAVSGYAATTNPKLQALAETTDILHSWPEYWDEQKGYWVPVDPTWEKTTRGFDYFSKSDLAHFVFVIHGQDSQKPYPAGSYKSLQTQGKDIQVVFGQYAQEDSAQLTIEFDLPSKLIGQTIKKGRIIFKNAGPVALWQLNPQIKTENITVSFPQETISVLPPFGVFIMPVKLQAKGLLGSSQGQLSLQLNQQTYKTLILISPVFEEVAFPLLAAVTCFLFWLYVKKRNK